MKTLFYPALFLALLTAGCAANSPAGTVQPLAAVQDTVDAAAAADLTAADSPSAETDLADGSAADLQTADASADTAKPLPATKGLQMEPLALPEFNHVVDSAGQAVSKGELLGHYTVLWFYPAAGTGG